MKLLLDIGNSSVNWAIAKNDRFIASGAFNHTQHGFEEGLRDNLLSLEKPTELLVANVAGKELYDVLTLWARKQWQLECWQANVKSDFNGLTNSYDDTKQMGIDRWLAMIAAWDAYQSALLIIGCGTALTIDAIDADGHHLGGYIVPGIDLMQASLIERTGQINIEPAQDASLNYAKDTQAAINNGAFLATVAIIEKAMANFSDQLKSRPLCIISGGMAELINPLLEEPFIHKTNLVLSGLLIANKAAS